ncbi:MAG: AgmX/PglI C-terminal domain-containing protein [Halioglobus sp.]
MTAIMPAPELLLPWESSGEEDRRFRSVLRTMLLLFGVLAIAVPLLPVTYPVHEESATVPAQLARIILQEKALPEPVKPPPKPVVKKVEPPRVAKPRELPREKPRPADQVKQARSVAAVSGLLAFQDELSEMRDSVDVNSLNHTQLSRGQESAAETERAVITSGVRASSGGIKTSAASRDAGGDALSGRETTRVQSAIASSAKETGQGDSVALGGRSDESIRRTMDRNKSAIFAIYNRALRADPLLAGKLVFEMVIDPAGTVVQITLVSSELSDQDLTNKILSRIRLINFGAEDAVNTRVHYSFDFLPFT